MSNVHHAIPDLERNCNSWIVTERETGRAIVELYTRNLVGQINQGRYRIETALQYLYRINGTQLQKEGAFYDGTL